MKVLRLIRNQIILTGAVCVAGYVAYQVLLDDEAKGELRQLVRTVRGSYYQLADVVNQRIGTIMDEDLVMQNRQQIRDAWADLGY